MTVAVLGPGPRLETTANTAQTTLAQAMPDAFRPNWIVPVSTAGFPATPGFRVVIGTEILLVVWVAPWGAWYAEAVEGTTAAPHAAGAQVTQVLTAAALTQMIEDHRAVGAPNYNPHPQYIRKGNYRDSWMTRDWGLIGDGASDNTDALQYAIDTLTAAGGGTIWIGPGRYMHRGIILKTGVVLRGAGPRSTKLVLIGGANNHCIVIYPSSDAVEPNAYMTGVMDIGIDGQRKLQSDTGLHHGIVYVTNPVVGKATNDLDQDMHHLFQDVHIENIAGTGFYSSGRGESRLINVRALYCQQYGFQIGVDTFLAFCTAAQTGSHGFVANAVGSGRLVGCKAFYAGRLIDQGTYAGNSVTAAGFWLANSWTLSLVDCEAQDCMGQGFFLENSNRITLAGCLADSNSVNTGNFAGFQLWNSDYCTLAGCIAMERKADGVNSNQLYAVDLRGGDDHNIIDVTHSAMNNATIGTALFPGSTITSSTVNVNGSNYGLQTPVYAASYTPDPYNGEVVLMTLTGAITVNNPTTAPYPGQRMTFVFVQDATGGRVVTWGSLFKQNWTPTTTASRRNTISFVYDGTNWQQISSAINTP